MADNKSEFRIAEIQIGNRMLHQVLQKAPKILQGVAGEETIVWSGISKGGADRALDELQNRWENQSPPTALERLTLMVEENRVKIKEDIGMEIEVWEGEKKIIFVLVNVNDCGVLYWVKKGRKTLRVIGYEIKDLPRLRERRINK